MTTFEEFLDKATSPGSDRLLPGAVVIAANKDGRCAGLSVEVIALALADNNIPPTGTVYSS